MDVKPLWRSIRARVAAKVRELARRPKPFWWVWAALALGLLLGWSANESRHARADAHRTVAVEVAR